MTNNNILYIIIALVVIAVIGVGIYWYMQSQNSYTATPYSNTQNSTMPTNSGTQNNTGTSNGY